MPNFDTSMTYPQRSYLEMRFDRPYYKTYYSRVSSKVLKKKLFCIVVMQNFAIVILSPLS